jgi:hypothetical protein
MQLTMRGEHRTICRQRVALALHNPATNRRITRLGRTLLSRSADRLGENARVGVGVLTWSRPLTLTSLINVLSAPRLSKISMIGNGMRSLCICPSNNGYAASTDHGHQSRKQQNSVVCSAAKSNLRKHTLKLTTTQRAMVGTWTSEHSTERTISSSTYASSTTRNLRAGP